MEESRMLLQLMVDATSLGWSDANGMLSKETLLLHNFGFGWDPTTKKFAAPEEVWKDYFKVREKEREEQSYMWDVIKETPNLDEHACYKAFSLLNNNTKKDAFLKMSLEERSNWISYNLE
ncbi:uncharacterized protein At2g29880-like [Prunus dulcis]|uniref:uncharacterized protein At2g29880-like n=1 Tax=Prunus dulcis TaxID=3755 RepID=UPI001483C976|nr:uncharacterized protein At2g29880-like [Prunus dulcis]